MRVKSLIALFAFFSSAAAMAYCANSYEVTRDAGEVERYARDISYEANRYGQRGISRRASALATSAGFLESSARGSFNSCAQIRMNFNSVASDYRQLQNLYQRNGRHNRDLSYEFQRLASSFRSLSHAMRTVRPLPPRRYDPPRRHPRRYDPPRRHPRRYDPPRRGRRYDPPRRGRRYDPPRRRGRGRVNRPGRRHNPRGNAPRRGRGGNRGRHNRV